MATDFDVVVVGGGPGGYTAALLAAAGGLSAALVERDGLGGTCLLRGCIPTKALVETSRLYAALSGAAGHGIRAEVRGLDWAAALERKDGIVERLRKGVAHLLSRRGVEVVEGSGRVAAPGAVEAGGRTLRSRHVILATGSAPALPPGLEPDGERVLTSEGLLRAAEPPSSLLVVGGGVIGCEFASIFAPLGTEVTVVELLDTLLPGADPFVAKAVARGLKKRKVKIRTGEKVVKLEAGAGGCRAYLSSGRTWEGERVLLAVGRRPAADEALAPGLAERGPGGEVTVDEACRTSAPGLWAVGDVTGGGLMLAHWASHMARVAVENILGRPAAVQPGAVPSCVFTTPEAAWVGLSASEAGAAGLAVRTGAFPFRALGRAHAGGEIDGEVRVVAEEGSGRVVGVQAVGPHVTDLVAEAALAVRKGLTAADIEETIHAHPTFPEALAEAAAGAFGRAIHV